MIKKTIKDFIKEAKIIHEDKYDYSLSKYINNNTKLIIICNEHGIFEQKPVKHINNKQGCPKCAINNAKNKQKKSLTDLLSSAKIIHSNKYDYSLVNYINNKTKINIICPVHGEFEQTPDNHLAGKGCKYCGGTTKLDTKLFILKAKEIHEDKYDYSIVNYINSQTKIKIICPEHGEFEQTPNNHLSKSQGCFSCLDKIFDNKTFIDKATLIHNNKYNYDLVEYINSQTKVKIVCPEHDVFEQRPNSHLNGSECPKCFNSGISKLEIEINEFINNIGMDTITSSRSIIPPQQLDIYILSKNIAIEFDGLYWHSEEYKDKSYHLNKTKLCEKKGIKLIHIFEDEWIYKQDICKSRLRNILGLTENRIFGRKCEIKEVNSKDSKAFLDMNHLQGNVNAGIKLGLYHMDELVSLMTFGTRPKLNSSQFEMIRFCNKLNTSVIGGADRLLKHFIKAYNPREIISYADRRWSQGELYDKLGFEFRHNTIPNFWYILNKKRENRLKYQKHILIKNGYDKNKTAILIMQERGINRIYDCGNKCYIMKLF